MEINYWIAPIAALVPMIIGFIWYHPKVLGTIWMKETGLTEEKLQSGNMGLIMGLSYVFACLLGMAMIGLTIHQFGFQSLLIEPGTSDMSAAGKTIFDDVMSKYGNNYRTFKHGALHGVLGGISIALPIIAIKSQFERKSWKYIWINSLYWIVTLGIMGGIVCQFA